MSSILEATFASLIIRATCVTSQRRTHGFVVSLSQDEAYFVSDDVMNVGEQVSLQLDLPWGMGQIRPAAEVEELIPYSSERSPRVRLALRYLSLDERERVQRYLTRFSFLIARLLS